MGLLLLMSILIFIYYDDLNENGPDRLIDLNTWSPVGRALWEALGGVSLLEEVCHGDEL